MNAKKLIFWGALFCVLLTYLLVFEQNVPRKKKTPAKQLERVFIVAPEKIQSIEISRGGKKVGLMQYKNGWVLVDPATEKINQEAVEGLVSAITDLVRIEVVSSGSTDLNQYGLHQPEAILSVVIQGNAKPVTLLLGKDTPPGQSMYAMIQGSNEVIQIGTLLRFFLNTVMELYAKDKI